jgi:hypothetical protein
LIELIKLRDHLEKSFLEAAPLPPSINDNPEIWSCEKIASAFKLFEAAASSEQSESPGLDSRTVAKVLLDKVRCIGSLLDVDDESSPTTDFNDLVFGTSTPVPSQKELIYWYILDHSNKFHFMFTDIGVTMGGVGGIRFNRLGSLDNHACHIFGGISPATTYNVASTSIQGKTAGQLYL